MVYRSTSKEHLRHRVISNDVSKDGDTIDRDHLIHNVQAWK